MAKARRENCGNTVLSPYPSLCSTIFRIKKNYKSPYTLQEKFKELKEVGLTEIPPEIVKNIEKEWEDMSGYMKTSPSLEQSKICRAMRDAYKIVLEEIKNVR